MISGDRTRPIINTGALQDFVYGRGIVPFRRPIVVGSELVSLSALLTCLKAGIRPVAAIDHNKRPIAPWPFSLFPRVLAIPVHYGATIAEIRGNDRVRQVSVKLSGGAVKDFACDGVLLTGQFVPEAALVAASGFLDVDIGTNGPVLDQFGRCSDSSYFAAGNVSRPVESAGYCYDDGRKVAAFVAADLNDRLPTGSNVVQVSARGALTSVTPQRIAFQRGEASATIDFQLRADRTGSGQLDIMSGDQVVQSHPIHTRREHRKDLRVRVSKTARGDEVLTFVLTPKKR